MHKLYPQKQICITDVQINNGLHRGHPATAMKEKEEAFKFFNDLTLGKDFILEGNWSRKSILHANEKIFHDSVDIKVFNFDAERLKTLLDVEVWHHLRQPCRPSTKILQNTL